MHCVLTIYVKIVKIICKNSTTSDAAMFYQIVQMACSDLKHSNIT